MRFLILMSLFLQSAENMADLSLPPAPQLMTQGGAVPLDMGHGEWSHALCDCMSSETKYSCCVPCFCASCQQAKTHKWLRGDRLEFCECTLPFQIWIGGFLGAMCSGVGSCILLGQHYHVRRELVQKFGIDEGSCHSCLVTFFCEMCSSVQMTNTVADKVGPAVPVRLFMSDKEFSEPLLDRREDL